MSIEPTRASLAPTSPAIPDPPPLIKGDEIKAILYLGIKGEVILPTPERTVDIFA